MADTIENILGFAIFSTMLFSVFADLILSAIWAKIYFTWGLVVFSRRISVEFHHTNIPSATLLNGKLYSFWMGGYIFRELDTNKYGFRHKFFSFAPRPMLHGLLTFDPENHVVSVKGYPAWFMVAFSIMWLFILPLAWLIQGAPVTQDVLLLLVGVMAFYGLITAILYLMDYYRLVRIIRVATDLWTRKYVSNQ
jgi:hypothetical protein